MQLHSKTHRQGKSRRTIIFKIKGCTDTNDGKYEQWWYMNDLKFWFLSDLKQKPLQPSPHPPQVFTFKESASGKIWSTYLHWTASSWSTTAHTHTLCKSSPDCINSQSLDANLRTYLSERRSWWETAGRRNTAISCLAAALEDAPLKAYTDEFPACQ